MEFKIIPIIILRHSLLMTVIIALFTMIPSSNAQGSPQVPCFFVFGDSMNDCGNNNDLETKAKANYKPYGIDSPNGVPTGRFTNGRTTVDFLAEELGFDRPIPPFTTAQGEEMLQGVNYASGSAGILDNTGNHLGRNVPLRAQIQNHQFTFTRIAEMKGNNKDSAFEHLNTCMYYMQIGSNDYLNNFFVPDHYPTSKEFTVEDFGSHLVSSYEEHIRTLYNYGARKIAVTAIGKIGCIPYAMNKFGTNGTKCIQEVNTGAKFFNKNLKRLVVSLNKEYGDAMLIYINTYGMADGDPSLLGFSDVVNGCCKSREDGQCEADQVPCENRGQYVFWDSFHPTEASNKATAARTYKSFAPSDCDPFDLHTLAKFDLSKGRRSTEEVQEHQVKEFCPA